MSDKKSGFKPRKMTANLIGYGLFALAVGSTCAGEVAPPPAGPLVAEAPKEEKILDEKPFTFEPGERRDPFTFVSKVEIQDATPPPGKTDGEGTINIDPLVIQQKKAEAEAAYADAEKSFLDIGREGKPAEVLGKCDVGLKIFKDIPNLSSLRELQEIRERLSDLRKAAERMKSRQEAEKKFREMHIKLTGVVARDRRSQAIINGYIKGKGDVVPASDNYTIIVDEIMPDRVVVVSPEGFKMMLIVGDGGK